MILINKRWKFDLQIIDDLEDIEKFEVWELRNKDNVTNTNDNSSDVSSESVAVGRGTIIAGGEINDDISVITESATVNLLTQQAEYYESDDKEELKMDTLKTIQTYLKKIFRQAKFLSDTGSNS